MTIKRLIAVSAATFSAAGLLVPPAHAVQLSRPASAPSVYDSHAEDAFGYRHRHWRRDRVNGGDIVAGVLVLGAVAAIASAASDGDRDRDQYRDRPVPYREPSQPSRSWGQGGIGNAVDLCVDQVERGRTRVDSVDNATRGAGGWRVSGTTSDGEGFSCRLDNDGRIRAIDLGDDYAATYGTDDPGGAGFAQADGQLSDETYQRARAALRQNGGTPLPRGYAAPDGVNENGGDADLTGPQPAYPGGPLPGEEGYEDSLGG